MTLSKLDKGGTPTDYLAACRAGAKQHAQMRRVLGAAPASNDDYDLLPAFKTYVHTTREVRTALY